VSLNSLLLFCTVNSIAVMISAGSEDSGAVTGKTTAVILAMYFIDFLSNVWPYVSPLGSISIFHYYQPSKIIENGLLPWSDFSVLIILAVIFYGIAIFVFKSRDISR
jgi:ABC-type transport system involved in multi-copper enzyme maturation permease subunit